MNRPFPIWLSASWEPLRFPLGLLMAVGFLASGAAVWGQNFSDTGFSSELLVAVSPFGPVGVAWAPDGRMFIWQKNGVVRIFKNGSLLSVPFLDFSSKINTYNDNGMFCLAFDPSFASNRYIYLTYVYESGTNPNDNHPKISRLVRVTASSTNPDLVLAGSEVILLNNLPVDYGTHALGTIRFAPDGKLFVGNGDGANPGALDSNAWGAQDLNNVRGKIFRITRDGKAPGDNPFDDGTDSVRSKVWAYGVRNPYRFSLHPVTGVPYFADVGWNEWEEIDRGVRGGNFGWPCYEGSRAQSGYSGQLPQCAGVTSVIAPIYEYAHGSQGTCIVGGDFYTGTQYPEAYRGNYFFGDYSGNFIRRLVLNASGTVTSTLQFASDAGAPTCIEQGPDGALYLVSFARGEIRRITFNGPAANASATPTYGYSPLTVSFSSAGSTSGGGSLTYLWEFGDGTRSSQASPSHIYTSAVPTNFNAKLTITNASRLTSSANVQITVGSLPPSARISGPADGTGVFPGQVVFYQGSASDPDDGPLPATSLYWTVLLHHNTHVHSFVGGSGASGSFEVENHGTIGTFGYEIILTATDSSGLQGTASVQLQVLADTVAPTIPATLTAAAISGSRVNLAWQPSSDNAAVGAYQIERCRGAGCGDFAPLTTVLGTDFEDAGLWPTNSYSYRVRAVDFSGNTSDYSDIATVVTLNGGPPVSVGLVAAYSFSEGFGASVADASGNGHAGTLYGATWSTQGKFGSALSFDGAGLVSVNHSALLALSNAMTLEAWVFPTTPAGGWRDIIFKNSDIYYLMGSSSQGGFPATGGTFTTPLFGTSVLATGAWSHLAATYDGAALRLYVNGVLVGSRSETTLIRPSTGALTIGGDPGFGQYWQGLIDEVRIYDRALTASEIQQDMVLPIESSGNQPPLAAASASPIAGAPPLAVSFSSAGSFDPEGAALTYQWLLGDGTSSSEPNPTHVYLSPGTYVARLTVSDGTNATTSGDVVITVSSINGLVAAYGFEEGNGNVVADVSGLNNFGTIRAATWTTGRFGKALEFDGTYALISVQDAPSLDLAAAMTLEAWVYPTAIPTGWRDIIYKEDDSYYLEGSSTQTGTPTAGGTFNPTPLRAPSILPLNTWSHLACTYDGTVLRLYVNGVQVANHLLNGPIQTSDHPLTIGGDQLYGQFWQGRIDEVRIYNRALSGTEIRDDMDRAVVAPVASVTASPMAGPAPLLVTFSASGSFDPGGGTLTYSWDFGDGSSASTSMGPSHTYHAPGVFVAHLTVSDGIYSTLSSNLIITVTNVPPNSLPTLTHISDVDTTEDVPTGPLAFVVGDAETAAEALTISGKSSNPILVPDANIVFGGSGSNRTVSVTPAANQNGLATITLTVSDGVLSASDSFVLRVAAVNDRPTASAIADQTTLEGTPLGPLAWKVSDVETPPNLLILTGLSSDQGMIPNENILFGGSGSDRTVTVVPAPNQHGTATITLTVSDSELEASTRFQLQVIPVPVILTIVDREVDGSILLRVAGSPGGRYLVETSTDLTAWNALTVVSDLSGVSQYADHAASEQPRKFYRVHQSP